MSNRKNQNDIKISEKELILNRTLPGRLAAKRMGKTGGRQKKLTPKKIELAKKLYYDPNNSIDTICKILQISKTSFYTYLYDRHR